MSDPIADIESYVKEAGGAHYRPAVLMLVSKIEEYYRQLIGHEWLKRAPMNFTAAMTASEILINKEQAYELGWNEAKALTREICGLEASDE